jgi:DNA-binding MarR family transcriptional regulator
MSTGSQKQAAVAEGGLSESERSLWFAWKRAHEVIRTRVADEIRVATGLSDPDVAILIQVDDADGLLRQSELVAKLGWDRTRLSHHLSRMEERGLVSRQKRGAGVEVALTSAGHDMVRQVQPIHATAVRQHLIEPFTPEQVSNLREALARISAPAER